jgi:DNA-binding IclR family transcriptional regulator
LVEALGCSAGRRLEVIMRPLHNHEGQPSDLVQSVSRALRVLEVVGASSTPLPAKAIARRCGLNLSTTYHLLRTLCYEGYLIRDASGDYRLGLQLARRYRDLRASFAPAPEAHGVLATLAAATGHSAYLGTFVEGRVAIVDVVEGPRSPHVSDLMAGYDEAAHATSIGLALLGTLSPEDRREYLRLQGRPQFTPDTLTDPDELQAELAALPPVVVEDGRFRSNMSCAAVVIPHGPGEVPMALAMSGPRGSFAPGSHLLRKLTEAGRQVAEAYHSAYSSHSAHIGNSRPSVPR